MEIAIGAKIRVPFRGELVVATVTDIESLVLPNKEKGWAIHLVGDPPLEDKVFGFPIRGDINTVSIAQIEAIFEQQLKSGIKPAPRAAE